ncbi:HNH endonuclease [Micromonospora chersina]|uniref:HNH endonuclease n=1 Tax=Micromonospora chersina TaxID=47854 RepID=UPI0033B16F8C
MKAQYAAKRIPTPLFKRCLACGQEKLATDYNRHPDRPDGMQAYCKPCQASKTRAYHVGNAARPEIALPDNKTCGRCHQTLPGAAFFRDARKPDGLYANCKRCHTELTDGWKMRNPHAVRRHMRASYRRHAAKRQAAARADYWANREVRLAKRAAWKRANRARATAAEALRRGRKANAPGDATTEQVMARWRYYGDRCWMCGDRATATDHVKPLAAGGSNWPANLRPACEHCNCVKGHSWPLTHLPARLSEAALHL